MKKHIVQQEILLVTSSSYSQLQWCEKDNTESGKHLTTVEQLEAACRNGQLDEMVPGIMQKSSTGSRLFIRHILQREGLFQIGLSESIMSLDKYDSLDPEFFLPLLLAVS